MTVNTNILAARSREELLRRNSIFDAFIRAEAPRLAEACHEMSRRFLAGGRLRPSATVQPLPMPSTSP